MGYYLEVQSGTKKEFLENYGELVGNWPPKAFERGDELLVCLVNNGYFFAAAIIYSAEELARFSRISDTRARLWYYLNRSYLEEFLPNHMRILS